MSAGDTPTPPAAWQLNGLVLPRRRPLISIRASGGGEFGVESWRTYGTPTVRARRERHARRARTSPARKPRTDSLARRFALRSHRRRRGADAQALPEPIHPGVRFGHAIARMAFFGWHRPFGRSSGSQPDELEPGSNAYDDRITQLVVVPRSVIRTEAIPRFRGKNVGCRSRGCR